MHTPWGKSQSFEQVTNGVIFVTTASHGGYKLSAERNKEIPMPYRTSDGWYEEDCEAALVGYFLQDACFDAFKSIAKETVQHWYPEALQQEPAL
jgi:hypothetical protein